MCKVSLALKRLTQASRAAGEAMLLAEELWGGNYAEAGTVISDLIFLEALQGHPDNSLALALTQRLRQIPSSSL